MGGMWPMGGIGPLAGVRPRGSGGGGQS
jgi:hypothetical protein